MSDPHAGESVPTEDQDCPSAEGRTNCILQAGHAGVHVGANGWTWARPNMQDIPGEGWK